jgi:excisionase family DNA binding protein
MASTVSSNSERVAYRVDEFCASTGLSRSKVYEEIASGRLKAVKCGSRTLIPASASQAWLESLPAKAA